MNSQLIRSAALVFLTMAAQASAKEPFQVVEMHPSNRMAEVDLEPLIQIHVSEKFDPATVNEAAVILTDVQVGQSVKVNIGGDLGGVVTVSVIDPLAPGHSYRLEVTSHLRNLAGQAIRPARIGFRTTNQPAGPPRSDIDDFRFTKELLDRRDGVCGLALFKDQLFACTWDGKLVRYRLSQEGAPVGDAAELLSRKRRFNAIAIAPASTPQSVVLWLSHDSQHKLSLAPNDFSGVLSRLTIEGDAVKVQDVIVGLPTGDHPASGLTFGPDNRLYVSQGALSMLGGKAAQPETPLSAATLAINLSDPLWKNDLPIDVKSYTSETNPHAVEVFATGIREAFDLCWHSSGQLFAGVNMNDTQDSTPGKDGLPAISVRPTEMMLRIVKGKYYGHPNPSRNQWVLLGGNPTALVDPWEVAELPVGTKPEPNFDASLLIRDLEKDKGPSADGVCEWTGDGPLQSRLLFCFYTATRGIHTYRVSPAGQAVSDHQPLVDHHNRLLRFGAPLDVVHDRRGWLYVADFSAPERGDSGMTGGVWLVKPEAKRKALSR